MANVYVVSFNHAVSYKHSTPHDLASRTIPFRICSTMKDALKAVDFYRGLNDRPGDELDPWDGDWNLLGGFTDPEALDANRHYLEASRYILNDAGQKYLATIVKTYIEVETVRALASEDLEETARIRQLDLLTTPKW